MTVFLGFFAETRELVGKKPEAGPEICCTLHGAFCEASISKLEKFILLAFELRTDSAMPRILSLVSFKSSIPSDAVHRATLMYAMLIVLNIGAWAWAMLAFHHHPILLGAAFLAYSFGLRHAVDADHIAAIDNVTRKLMGEKKRPVAVGFFFSLGHSSIVFGLSIAIAMTSILLKKYLNAFESIGQIVGTSISAFFLLLIALANIFILISIYRSFQHVKRGGKIVDEEIDAILAKRGFWGRFFNKLLRLIKHSWQMYLIGFLFGLGFDTATEVGLLGISAAEATKGIPIWSILVFPALFTAGMALVDSTDGILMLGAYGWAFVKPIRKLHYNMTIIAISVIVALLIGGTEMLGIIGLELKAHGLIWNAIALVNNNSGFLGLAIIGIFVVCWAVSIVMYRINCYDEAKVVEHGALR